MNKVFAIQTSPQYDREKIAESYQKLISNFNDLADIVKPGEKVLIKPNIVAPFQKAVTDLFLLEKVICSVLEIGAVPIVAESSGFEFSTKETFRILGLDKLCKSLGVRLVNLENEEFVPVQSGNPLVPVYLLPELLFKVDKFINMPRLKGHSLTKVTFSIKNLFGLLHRKTRRQIHAANLELGIRYLKKLVHVDFIIVDGLWNLSNAVYSDSAYRGILVCGNDMTAVDICCCNIFGVDYRTIPHICDSEEKIGSKLPNYLSMTVSQEKLAIGRGHKNEFSYKELSPIVDYGGQIRDEAWYRKQNLRYKIMYNGDLLFSKIWGQSAIPYFHFFCGIRPYIDKRKCKSCGKCEEICPVGAISNGKISIKACMNVRCLKCLEICPYSAISKKGFHKA